MVLPVHPRGRGAFDRAGLVAGFVRLAAAQIEVGDGLGVGQRRDAGRRMAVLLDQPDGLGDDLPNHWLHVVQLDHGKADIVLIGIAQLVQRLQKVPGDLGRLAPAVAMDDLPDLLVLEVLKPVGRDDHHVAELQLERLLRAVRARDLAAQDDRGQAVAVRMVLGRLGRDQALPMHEVDLRRERVVLVELAQLAVAHQVERAVPDRHPVHPMLDQDQADQRRAHALRPGIRLDVLAHRGVGRLGGRAHHRRDVGLVVREVGGAELQVRVDARRHDLRGDVAGGVAAHPVGQDGDAAVHAEREVGDDRVLLVGPPALGDRGGDVVARLRRSPHRRLPPPRRCRPSRSRVRRAS